MPSSRKNSTYAHGLFSLSFAHDFLFRRRQGKGHAQAAAALMEPLDEAMISLAHDSGQVEAKRSECTHYGLHIIYQTVTFLFVHCWLSIAKYKQDNPLQNYSTKTLCLSFRRCLKCVVVSLTTGVRNSELSIKVKLVLKSF